MNFFFFFSQLELFVCIDNKQRDFFYVIFLFLSLSQSLSKDLFSLFFSKGDVGQVFFQLFYCSRVTLLRAGYLETRVVVSLNVLVFSSRGTLNMKLQLLLQFFDFRNSLKIKIKTNNNNKQQANSNKLKSRRRETKLHFTKN